LDVDGSFFTEAIGMIIQSFVMYGSVVLFASLPLSYCQEEDISIGEGKGTVIIPIPFSAKALQ
jgi:hypothetical protein